MKIQDGKGKGYEAGVTKEGHILTDSVQSPRQHHVSSHHSKSYQVSHAASIAATTTGILLLQNDSDNDLVITYMRLNSVGAIAETSTHYWAISGGGEYASGGTTLTASNMKIGANIPADATAYGGQGILDDGNYVEFDRNYQVNSMQSYNKEGSLIVPRGQSILISYVSPTAQGVAYARAAFYYDVEGE